ncbi:MAG: alpha-mannosidase [Clostridia bacterium]|nr:alpha-mannosidase [Clostridia bacterium]
MTFADKLKKVRSVFGTNYWADRLGAELTYMTCLSSVRGHAYDKRIEEALDFLIAALDKSHTISKETGEEAEAMLADLSPAAKSLKVYCISHAHIDMNWMWGFQETASVAVDTFRTVLELMKEYPEFTFAQSQASTYRIIEDYAPDMLDEIRKYVHEGRWEVSASTWTETDKNMPSGESLSRHILYTKRYLGKLLDIDPDSIRMDFEPDTFGHNLNVPEICQNGGIDYYYHMRANDDRPELYRWRARSGKELLVFHDTKSYNGDINIRTFEDLPLFCDKNGTDTYLMVYGVGDHGGGPTRNDIERIIDDAKFPLYPTVEFGTYAKFFAACEKIRDTLPVIDHELNFVFTGCYTSQTRIKMANRMSEDRSFESECLAAAATGLTGAPGRTDQFRTAWEKTLFNHFHDILPGSGIVDTREYALGHFQDAMAGIGIAANSAMKNLSDAIDTSGIKTEPDPYTNSEGGGVGFGVGYDSGYRFPQTERGRGKTRIIHLFNPTMYDRQDCAEITVWDWRYDLGRAEFTDPNGERVPFEILTSGSGYWGHWFTRFLVKAPIPAFGYTTLVLRLRDSEGLGGIAGCESGGWCDYIADTPTVLENEKLRAVFDPYSFAMTELVDKKTGERIVTPEKPSALFRFIEENPRHGMTAWRVGPYMRTEVLNTAEHAVRLIDRGATGLRSWLKYEIRFASSTLTVTAELRSDADYINFHIDVDWHEIGRGGDKIPQLNFSVPVAYAVKDYTYDIPMGVITRGDIAHDVPGNSFMRLNKDGNALYLVTDTKYGFRGHDNAGAVTLIRASVDPDPYPERGVHHINIGVGLCTAEEQKKSASLFVHPASFRAGTSHKGTLPLCGSFMRFEGEIGDRVMTSGVKNGEDGGLIVRVSDYAGKGGDVTLALGGDMPVPKSACLVDITERHVIGECAVDGRKITFPLAPYTMATLKIE